MIRKKSFAVVAGLLCTAMGHAMPVSLGTLLYGDVGPIPTGSVGMGTTQFLAEEFSVFDALDVNVIYVNLYLPGGPTTVTALTLWVTDKIGPGTTASDVLYQTMFDPANVLGDAYQPVLAVTAAPSVSLAPGNYFLVLSSSGTFPVSSGGSDYSDWIKSSPAPYPENIAGAPGPGFYACCIVGTNTDTVFPPDSEFTAAGSEFAFVIDANSVATPESGSFVFLSLGIACLLGLRRVYRDKFAHH